MTTVIDSDFERRDTGALMRYIEHEEENLRDRTGQEMDASEQQHLLDRSEEHGMSRHLIISPENAEQLDNEEIGRATRKTIRETIGSHEGVDWAYAVHRDGGDRPHAHVVATGRADQPGDPLWIDRDDLDQIRDRAHEHSIEQEQGVEYALDQALDESLNQEQAQEQISQELDQGRDQGPSR
ncbi:relaxase/mobilization nuclease domain-containing protein [Halarchaeum nitratireducens]|uniref:MobA/VirD2-like nuclease domain-containing protein n=1 Tax=Halarchaeum nitratireducens TaxID=489913 RepID=A0A830GFS2_9EURY|nr:hypothetical protein [Halarchaeum nitratireducens]GGN26497.1 hypothetical protein GCM10009021_31100 [Halarchaeum nitratireducens]